jgi:hypothetical protein
MGFFEKIAWAWMASEALPYLLAITIGIFLVFFYKCLKKRRGKKV